MAQPKTVRVGMGQMRIAWGEPERNLARAEEMIVDASEEGCQIIVLPECLDIGWTHPDVARLAEPVPGARSERLAAAARTAGIWVVAGLTERDGADTYNAAILVSPQGEILLKHRKITVLGIALPFYTVGRRVGVADTPFGRVGVDICADNFMGTLSIARAMGEMEAGLVLSPCAWAVDADDEGPYGETWKKPYKALAEQYGMGVVGVSGVGWMGGGPWEGRKCIGNSIAVNGEAALVVEGPFGVDAEALLTVELRYACGRGGGETA